MKTLDQIRDEKSALELQLMKMIRAFEDEHGVSVTAMYLTKEQSISVNGTRVAGVELTTVI